MNKIPTLFTLILASLSIATFHVSPAFSHENQVKNTSKFKIESPYRQAKTERKKALKKRTVLVTGCARSGTAFITKFLVANKLNVGHEGDASYGIVSWPMTGNAYTTPWGPGANNYKFEHVFHQVRHPLKVIASAGNEPAISWIYIRQFIPEIKMNDPKIVKGAKYWYYWNLLAERKAEWTYRIEDIRNQVNEMAARLEVELDPSLLENIPTNTNTRGYREKYTWNDLKQAIDEDLFYNIIEMALRYGYEIDD